jgi:transcription-repair coupling factor
MLLDNISDKLGFLRSDLKSAFSNESRKFILLRQTDFQSAGLIAELLGKVLNKRVDILAFKKGEHFRQWLNNSKKQGYANLGTVLFNLKVKDEYSVLELTNKLSESGYSRQIRAQEPGEFSLLGDVLQIYMVGFDEVLRVSFFGNQIEDLSFIDKESKKLLRKVLEINVIGYAENDLTNTSGLKKEDLKNMYSLFVGNTQATDVLDQKFVMVCDGLPGYDLEKFDMKVNTLPGGSYIAGEENAVSLLIAGYLQKDWSVHVLIAEGSGFEKSEFMMRILSRAQELSKSIDITKLSEFEGTLINHGFELPIIKTVYFTSFELEAELDLSLDSADSSRFKSGSALIPRGRIKKGDYVVHADHGVAVFEGIKQQDSKSYLLLRYAGEDRLYIPLDQIDKVTKYLGSRKGVPSLTKLNGGGWNRVKLAVRKDLEQIAKELLQLYTLRKNTKASNNSTINISVIGAEFTKFLKDFQYTETQDQIASTQEVIVDLQKGFPMDRLVVGDVGFGKTEVAMRAAFLIAMQGKQVAVLAPTTVLVEQHLGVFKKRFEQFPQIKIESISRFSSTAQQSRTIEKLERGEVNILIGTHSILSERVQFKDLGLIIIDEEQRFGVKHKEKLKLRRLDSHVLTLTATPIPRTLNMSLSGVRDISVIETPPSNRIAIKNYTGKLDWDLIKSAIEFEKSREGQIYFLHNRVRDIESVALKIHELMPNVNVDVAHGQMAVHHLAKVMREFAAGTTDVLVCTTIIENGIDLANVNTLIVDDVEKLGLAQMYQIRGRIGRSDKQAYAYLFYNSLRGNSSLRLEAMKEFEELGVGYRLANRDMEIRGAGAILGDNQSGFIDNVGYSLYMQMLNEAVGQDMNSTKLVKHDLEFVERIWLR